MQVSSMLFTSGLFCKIEYWTIINNCRKKTYPSRSATKEVFSNVILHGVRQHNHPTTDGDREVGPVSNFERNNGYGTPRAILQVAHVARMLRVSVTLKYLSRISTLALEDDFNIHKVELLENVESTHRLLLIFRTRDIRSP